MKNKIILYAALIPAIVLGASCSRYDEDLFSKSAADRMSDALKEYKKVLIGAPNGWIMEYYIGESPDRVGGYTFMCSFAEDNTVTMASEFAVKSYNAKDRVSSLYHLKSDQSAVLSFDTYNPIFHHYSEPQGSTNPGGRGGDYEFVLKQVDPDEIIMVGKKHGYKIRMTPLPADKTWDSYIDAVSRMADESFFPRYRVIVDGVEQPFIANGRYKTRRMVFTNADGVETGGENVYYTDEGFRYYEPVVLDGQEVVNFSLEAGNKFVCTDPGADVVLEGYFPDDYMTIAELEGSYRMYYTNYQDATRNPVVTLEQIPNSNTTMLLRNAAYFELIMEYDRDRGSVNFISQYLDEYSGFPTYLYMWLGGSRLIPEIYEDMYLAGVHNGDKVNTRIEFVSSDGMAGIVGVLLVLHTDDGYGLISANDCLRDITFVRQ